MFRKRDKKVGNNLRRKRNDDDEYHENGEGDDHDTTGIAIRETMKKHKILASLPLTSGGKNSRKGEKQLYSDQTKSQTDTTVVQPSPELSIIATKHKNNMEVFIEQQMTDTHTTGAFDERKRITSEKNKDLAVKGNLYQQLARVMTDVGGDNKSSNESYLKNEQQPQHDGDQGDGGAALLGGTGIAEVILPSTRHPSLVATIPKSSEVWDKNSSLLSSAVPEEEHHKQFLPDTTPKPFVKFRKITANSFTKNYHSNLKNDGIVNNIDNIQNSHVKTEATSDNNRKGFDAFRGRKSASDFSNEGNNANQNIYENNRKKTGKDRDDHVYSHFLRNALNGKNRR